MAERAAAPRVIFSALIAIWRRNYPIRELGWSGVGSGCEVLVITNNPSLLLRRLTSLCSALCLTPTLHDTKDGGRNCTLFGVYAKDKKKQKKKNFFFYRA